jgi:recombination protein RecT
MSTQVATINQVLVNEQPSLMAALPSHIKVEKFMQVCNTAGMINPELQDCSPSSLAQAFIQCAKDGLVPDGKESAIVIYNKKQGNNWVKEAQYQPMIDGILKRLRQSGEVPYISAKVVYNDDKFDTGMDINGEYLTFKPDYSSTRRTNEDIKLVFAMAKLKNGEAIVEVMTIAEVNEIMYLSKSAIDKKTGKVNEWSVWGKFFSRMALKSVLHRVSKRLPNSSEVMEMIERDIQIKDMKNGAFIDGDSSASKVQTIDQERINELQALVNTTNTNASQMFAFISSSSGRVVNDYQELDESQYNQLIAQLEKRLQGQVKKQTEEAMRSQEMPIEGELMTQQA